MKYYKLLKDTLTVKAGSIFEEERTFDDEKILVQVTKDGCQLSPSVAVRDINNFDGWFEEIPEKHERWRGGRGDSYYFIDDEGAIRHEIDINDGMMICVGDIVKMKYPYDKRFIGKFVVVKDPNSPRIGLLDKTKTDEIFNLYGHMSNYYEVIGNIHENPELLEEAK